uniref:Little elongation complex subunit 2 C-terminal domain-containing protein n=2 Tax=Clastoptera arizonana TaxID=38151 RepID=A0A1B6C6K2_9HEMI
MKKINFHPSLVEELSTVKLINNPDYLRTCQPEDPVNLAFFINLPDIVSKETKEKRKNKQNTKATKIKKSAKDFECMLMNKWVSSGRERATYLLHDVKREITRLWDIKRSDVFTYPKNYQQCSIISLASLEPGFEGFERVIHFERDEICECVGNQNHIIDPSLIKRCDIEDNAAGKQEIILPQVFLKESTSYPPVSLDPTVEKLLHENRGVYIVLSRSGIKTILDNHPLKPSEEWILPFCLKQIKFEDGTSKKVLYVDKALLKTEMSVVCGKRWHAKKAVNSFLFQDKLNYSELSFPDKEFLKQRSCEQEGQTKPAQINNYITNIVKRSYSYEIWSLNNIIERNAVLMKNAKKNFKILVRNKQPAKKENSIRNFCLSSKPEHQLKYGKEILSLSQYIREWSSLLLNPGGLLMRVRADAKNLAFDQTDTVDISNTEQNIGFFYNVVVKNQLNILQNVLISLEQLPVGNYILNRMPKGGLFATVYKESENGAFDLHSKYSNFNLLEVNVPWTPLDLRLVSPSYEIIEDVLLDKRRPKFKKKKRKSK